MRSSVQRWLSNQQHRTDARKKVLTMKVQLVILVGAAILAGVSSLEFKDCGSKVGKFENVKVLNCDESKDACILKRNTTAQIDLDLTLVGLDEVDNVTTVVHGILMGVPVPFPLENPDACATDIKCPLKSGAPIHYSTKLPVLKQYPKTHVIVKWELQTADKQDIICLEIPAKIQ